MTYVWPLSMKIVDLPYYTALYIHNKLLRGMLDNRNGAISMPYHD
ncbi:hypothetical protein [Bacillus sp. JJ1773]